MYLTFDEYVALGGTEYDEDAYEAAEWVAEGLLDGWTLNRLKAVDWSAWSDEVARAMYLVVGALSALDAAFDADTSATGAAGLTSFSNGVDSFGWSASSSDEDAGEYELLLGRLCRRVLALLPVELCSGCVAYNHAS